MVLGRLFARRRGNAAAPQVPENCCIYAVGDIHGRVDLLDRLQQEIAADAADVGAARCVLVFLGDYVDRGLDSYRVIERLLEPAPAGFERIFLKGNHDQWFRSFLEDPSLGPAWLDNGGLATLYSYGVAAPRTADDERQAYADLRDRLRAAVPDRHIDFLDALQRHHQEGDYWFVHAGVRPGTPLDQQSEDDELWIRQDFLSSTEDFGALIVHGHTVVETPEVHRNRIAVDTGAYASGKLTALRLSGETRTFLST